MNLLSFEIREDVSFDFSASEKYKSWLIILAELHDKRIGELQYVFCSEEYLWELNKEYLDHDTDTDIISFDSSLGDIISGEIYISVDRVRDNAEKYKAVFSKELKRVMSHGLLHLCGYDDKTEEQRLQMRSQEEMAIGLYNKINKSVPRGTS